MMKHMNRLLCAFLALLLILSMTLTAFAMGQKIFYTTGSVNMRSKPSLNGKVLASFGKNKKFIADTFEDDDRGVRWYYGYFESDSDMWGWVSSMNMRDEDGKTAKPVVTPKPTPKPTPIPIDYSSFHADEYQAEVTASSLNMREEPATDRDIVASYSTGAVLRVVRTNGSWAEVIDDATGRSGYMSLKYLKKVETAPAVVVMPVQTLLDVTAIPDGTYSAAFDDLDLNGNLLKLTFYTAEQFTSFDLFNLKRGDVIVVDGEEIRVNSVVFAADNTVDINGGLYEGGVTLAPAGTNGNYIYRGDDDIATYTELGTAKLTLADSLVYTDERDPANKVEATLATLALAMKGEYTPYDTTVTISGGAITAIARAFRP